MMVTENPYEAPRSGVTDASTKPTIMIWSIAIVFACALLGGVIGAAVGAALGAYLPGYYRSVFSGGQSADFDPLAVGIGQGLTQGVGFGGLVGIILVALFYWHRRRRETVKQ